MFFKPTQAVRGGRLLTADTHRMLMRTVALIAECEAVKVQRGDGSHPTVFLFHTRRSGKPQQVFASHKTASFLTISIA